MPGAIFASACPADASYRILWLRCFRAPFRFLRFRFHFISFSRLSAPSAFITPRRFSLVFFTAFHITAYAASSQIFAGHAILLRYAADMFALFRPPLLARRETSSRRSQAMLRLCRSAMRKAAFMADAMRAHAMPLRHAAADGVLKFEEMMLRG
jgi:hypothetical protein